MTNPGTSCGVDQFTIQAPSTCVAKASGDTKAKAEGKTLDLLSI
jgi:hypothetical protein